MSTVSQHTEWLSLMDVSGPFLAIPVLERAFPQGLDVVETPQRQRLRQAYDEWRDSVDVGDPGLEGIHGAWLRLVLEELLEFDSEVMKSVGESFDSLTYVAPEHGVTLKPDFAVLEPGGDVPSVRLLVASYPPETDLEAVLPGDGWPASPAERMTLLCRATGVRLGLVTDGERWMLVDAPVGATAGYASWYARLWSQEPITLRAFQSLLGVRRFFGPEDETLEVLLESSLEYQEEVTDKLGEQVRRAVEVLVQALDRADIDRNRELLDDVTPPELYEAGLTVMMRLVFLLCAEERGLLLLGDSGYDQYYAISPLRAQLREEADRVGLEVLERRQDAWSRLLAVFRAVYGGIEHESLRMPALGGSLFDPDRFPFLEGRDKETGWLTTSAIPLPIDNHTVLMLLDALQVLEQRGGAQLLSYRALDVEQIGYVYEGLLEHTVSRVPHTTLGLVGSSKARNPNVELTELESANLEGEDALVSTLAEKTGRTKGALKNALKKTIEEDIFDRLLLVCTGDRELTDRIRPFASLLRTDNWGQPLVYKASSFAVTAGANRRETGTHYTPKSLTESIVITTLEPVVYVVPAEGVPREGWKLKSSGEILELKVCDPAMGSGAFLVQACRYISEKLVEAWQHDETIGKAITIDGDALNDLGSAEPMPVQLNERLTIARRLVAERCLYGVDVNPLAVELAKLSIWLVTLAKGRPFGFLDHNLRSGDSLLGIHRLEQLTQLRMNPESGQYQLRIFSQNVEAVVDEAIELRKRLRATTIRDIKDVEAMARLDREARKKLESVELIADAMIGEALRCGGNARALDAALDSLAIMAGEFLNGNRETGKLILKQAQTALGDDLQDDIPRRKPFHWIAEFPEVFLKEKSGFDGIVANPPWGAAITTNIQRIWKGQHAESLDRLVDSFHLFILRAIEISRNDSYGVIGYLVPDVLLYQGYSQRLRTLLLSKGKIIKVCNVGSGVFVGVTRPCCYIIFSKEFIENSQISVEMWHTTRSEEERFDYCDFMIKQTALLSFPGCVIPTRNIDEFVKAAEYVSALPCKVTDLVDEHGIQRGVSADNKDVFVITKEKSQIENLEQEWLKPVVTGGIHLKPFAIETELPLLIYTTKDTLPKEIPHILKWIGKNSSKITCKEVKQGKHPIYALHRPRDFRIFQKKAKILGVITSDRPKVAVDNNGLYAMDGVYVFTPRKEIDPYFLVGVLNSSFMSKIYQVFSQEEGRVMAQVKPTIIAQLPIVEPNTEDDELTELVSEISKMSKKLHVSGLEEDLKITISKQLDRLVSMLFKLAKEKYERRQLSSK